MRINTTSEHTGFSSLRMSRIDQVMQAYIDTHKFAGIVTLAAQHGEIIHFQKYGFQVLETNQPMELDTLFRIYSMTKPITAVAVMMLLAGVLMQSIEGQEARESYLSGLARMHDGKYAAAIPFLDRAIELDDGASVFHLRRAECLYEQKDYTGALLDLGQAGLPDDGKAAFLAARCYAATGDVDKCLEAMRSHLESDEKLPESTILLDEAFIPLENNRKWIDFWKKDWYTAEERRIADISYLVNSHHLLEAIDSLNRIIVPGKPDHRYFALRARAFAGLGNLNNAAADYGRAIESSGNVPAYYLERAVLWSKLNKPERAREDYSSAIRLVPDDFDARYARARICHNLSDLDAASKDMETLLRYFPDKTGFLYEAGMIYYQAGQYVKALPEFNKLLSISTDSACYFRARADTYLKTEYFRYAIRDYSMALDLDPDDAACYLNKGKARFSLGDREGACIDWQKALNRGSEEADEMISKHCR